MTLRQKKLWVTFQGTNKKKNIGILEYRKKKVREMMAAPSKGEYFMNNIHDQYSVNYQLHNTRTTDRLTMKNLLQEDEAYAKGMKAKEHMKGRGF